MNLRTPKRVDLQSTCFNHLHTCPKLSLVCESSNFSVGYHLCVTGLPAIAFSNAGPIVMLSLAPTGNSVHASLCFIPCMIPTFAFHIGIAGFEPAISRSQAERLNQVSLYPGFPFVKSSCIFRSSAGGLHIHLLDGRGRINCFRK